MESARPATVDDVPRLAALHDLAIAEISPARGGELYAVGAAREDPRAELSAAVDDPGQLVVVGEIDGWIAGYCTVRAEVLADRSVLGVIDDLFVEADARQVGVGEAMVDAVVEWCQERRCRGIDAVALPGDRHTKNFFESFGFTARAIVVHRALSDTS